MKEIIESLRDGAKERIKNPIFGAIFASWIVVNWDIVLLISTSKQDIENIIYTIRNISNFRLCLLPILLGIIYTLINPWGCYFIEKIRNIAFLRSKKDKLELEVKILTAKSDLVEAQTKNELLKDQIVSEMNYEKKSRELEISEKQQSLADNKKRLDETTKKYAEVTASLEMHDAELSEIKKNIQNKVSQLNDLNSAIEGKEQEFKNTEINNPPIQADFNIKLYVKNNLLNLLTPKIKQMPDKTNFKLTELIPADLLALHSEEELREVGRKFITLLALGEFPEIEQTKEKSKQGRIYVKKNIWLSQKSKKSPNHQINWTEYTSAT